MSQWQKIAEAPITIQLLQSKNFDHILTHLRGELEAVHGWDEYVIFGSTSLILRGILDREPGDLDMFVSKRVWGKLLPRKGWHYETPNAGDPPILVYDSIIPVHAFFDWSDKHVDMDVPALLKDPDYVLYDEILYNVVSVEEALRHKEEAINHGAPAKKHIPDIEIIKSWLSH